MRIRFFALFLLMTLLLASIPCAYGDSRQELKNSQDSIADNQEKIRQLEQKQNELSSELQTLSRQKDDTAAYIEELDRKVKELEDSEAELEAEILQTQEKAEKTEGELEEAENCLSGQKESMSLRIRNMYEARQGSTLELLLQSGSLADLLNSVEYIQKVNTFDREKLEEFRVQVKQTEEKKAELESTLGLLEEQKAALEGQLEAVRQLEEEKQQEIRSFEQKISSAEEESGALSASVEKLNAAIKAEEQRMAAIEAEIARQEEEARKKALAAKKEYVKKNIGDLDFLWPVPSSSRITSEFGAREAPVEGASTNHKGVDIGAASGEEILAAEGGTVVISTYSGSAGNYIMISHGGGIYTVYMHMTDLYVSEGDEVRRGDVIGTVGSTGYSSGPHLHFGLRIDGSYVDPLAYVSP